MKQGICHHCEVIESQANTCEGSQERKSQVFRTQQQCRRRPVWNTKSNFNTRRPEMRYYSVDLHLHLKFKPYIAKTPQQNKRRTPARASCTAPCPRAAQPRKQAGTGLAGRRWLLPALPVRQRLLLLLLTCDEGGAPHRAAVTVPEPTHGGRRRVRGTSETMVGLCLCGERRG